ncbi:MAG: dihydrolipoyl dehydrogenase [Betaproteobacteria bacterium]|jgi:dihydrolipoamide dehydrogenase|nr:Dihydrolipoyl dehydrogenase [Rhodocyclaceae bacterium]
MSDQVFDVAVLGAGPGGYAAAFRAADLGLATALIEPHATLGGVCLNVGCIPSKALLSVASTLRAARALAQHGVSFGEPNIDLDALRASKDRTVRRLTTGLAALAKVRKVEVIRGHGRFVSDHEIEVAPDGAAPATGAGVRRLRFAHCIIAVGSSALRVPGLPDDPRVLDSTGALALPDVPTRMLVVGGGIIGLELATVYAALGSEIHIVEAQDRLMGPVDADLVEVWRKHNAKSVGPIMQATRIESAETTPDGILVRFAGAHGSAEPVLYARVLVAAGRRGNGHTIGAERAGLTVLDNGCIAVDGCQRTEVPHIYAVGDVVPGPGLAHKASHQGHVAAEVIAGLPAAFDVRQIPAVAYTDPEIAWTGRTEATCAAEGIDYDKAVFPWRASGRALAEGRDEGMTKLLFDRTDGRLLGAGIVGLHAGELIGELGLALEMGANAEDIGHTIHPHPTLSESIGLAAELMLGACTDLPPSSSRSPAER